MEPSHLPCSSLTHPAAILTPSIGVLRWIRDKGKVKIEGPEYWNMEVGDQDFEMEDDQDELTFKYDDNGVLKVEGGRALPPAPIHDRPQQSPFSQ